jgi:hypothetical protein
MIRRLPLVVIFWASTAFADSGPLSGEALDQKCATSAKGLLQTVYRLIASDSLVVPAKDGKSRLIYLSADNGGTSEVHLYECSPQGDGSVALAYQGIQDKKLK